MTAPDLEALRARVERATDGSLFVAFGWASPSVGEQFPQLDSDVAHHFDQDNRAIVRLHVRGVLTDRERSAAFKRLTKKVQAALLAALSADPAALERRRG